MRSAAWLLVVVLALAANPASADKAKFAERCGRCHDSAAIAKWGERYPVKDARRARFDRFLQRHHAREAKERAAIIDHIESMIAAGRQG